MQLIRRAAFTPMRWRNGVGATFEIAVQGREGEHFDWRLSLALMEQDGPFSTYEGYERHTALVDGAGFSLQAPDGATLAFTQVGQVHAYAGDLPLACRLVCGAARDFNLIARRGLGARMSVVQAGELALEAGPMAHCLLPLQAALGVVTPSGTVQLACLDALLLDAGEPACSVATGAAAAAGWVAVCSLPPAPAR